MDDTINTIELIGVKKTRPILSCVRRPIERWIEQRQSLLFYPNRSFYRVSITRDIDAPIFTCTLRIQIGDSSWTGCESGKTLQDSLERTLAHLRKEDASASKCVMPAQALDGVA